MRVEVLYIAECPHHKPTVELAREALGEAGLPQIVEEVEVQTKADAEAWKFLGSPTVRVNGVDVEPEARGVQHFGFGCRSYLTDGIRSGLPSRDLIERAIHENSGPPARIMQSTSQKRKEKEPVVLVGGGLAAVLASSCCFGPLILVTLGFSGAWIGNLSKLEPFRPWFIAAALIALVLSGRRIFRPATACVPGEVCALPAARRAYKLLFGVVAALVVVAIGFPFLAPFFY